MWRKPSESYLPKLAGDNDYPKQVPLSRAVPLWGGCSHNGFSVVLFHERKKLTAAEWASAVNAGKLVAAIKQLKPALRRGPWRVLCDNEGFLQAADATRAHKAASVWLWRIPARSIVTTARDVPRGPALPEALPQALQEALPEALPAAIPEALPAAIPEAMPQALPEELAEQRLAGLNDARVQVVHDPVELDVVPLSKRARKRARQKTSKREKAQAAANRQDAAERAERARLWHVADGRLFRPNEDSHERCAEEDDVKASTHPRKAPAMSKGGDVPPVALKMQAMAHCAAAAQARVEEYEKNAVALAIEISVAEIEDAADAAGNGSTRS